MVQVITEAIESLTMLLSRLFMGLKRPVTTSARIRIGRNGRISHPRRIAETRKRPRKNHRMIPREKFSSIYPPAGGRLSKPIFDRTSRTTMSPFKGLKIGKRIHDISDTF